MSRADLYCRRPLHRSQGLGPGEFRAIPGGREWDRRKRPTEALQRELSAGPDSQHPDDGGAEVGTTKAKRAKGEDATRRDLHHFVPSVAPATVVLVADTYHVAIISLTV